MEIIRYIRLFRRWLWLILLAAFVGGAVTFIIARGRPLVYNAEVTLAIGRFIASPNPSAAEIETGIDLAQTYAYMVKTYAVLQGTIDELDLDFTVEELEQIINTRVVEGTSLLIINVTDTDPINAADIANTLASQLILTSPTNLTPAQQSHLDFANAQIDLLNQELREARLRLDALDTRIEDAATEAEIARLVAQRNPIVEEINEKSATIAEFSTSISALQQRSNALDIVDHARVPERPGGSNPLILTIIGVVVGSVLAVGFVLIIEYLNDTIRTTEEAAELLTLPVLGAIIKFNQKSDKQSDRLIMSDPSAAPAKESYRLLRTNLLYTASNKGKVPLVVTSPGPGEGKSTTTANLAVTMALAGLQVILIDADLRRPMLHKVFNLPNDVGLTTMLSSGSEKINNFHANMNGSGELPDETLNYIQTTDIQKLWVITSGLPAPNPTEMLGSPLFQKWIEIFCASHDIDVVLIDTPPCLVAADTSVLSVTTKAEVLLVIASGRTRREVALKAKQQFAQLNANLRGIILNRVNPRIEHYGYDYEYYSERPVGEVVQTRPNLLSFFRRQK